jgi:hypothetical protein
MGSMEAARWAGATAAQPETTIIAATANTKLTGWRARIVGDHADRRARSIDQRVSNCRATWLLAQVIETTPHTLSTRLDRCAPVTAYGAERPISDGRVGGDASPWQAPQAKRNLPLAAMSEDYYPEVGIANVFRRPALLRVDDRHSVPNPNFGDLSSMLCARE